MYLSRKATSLLLYPLFPVMLLSVYTGLSNFSVISQLEGDLGLAIYLSLNSLLTLVAPFSPKALSNFRYGEKPRNEVIPFEERSESEEVSSMIKAIQKLAEKQRLSEKQSGGKVRKTKKRKKSGGKVKAYASHNKRYAYGGKVSGRKAKYNG